MSRRPVTLGVLLLLLLSIPYISCVHYSEPTQVGIMRNWITGELKLDTPGWNLTAPWVSVAKIDTRPMRVCVTTAGRGFNCMLVAFEPTRFREFVVTEGFYYYWFANRISFNLGYDEEYRGVKDLLRGYAYSTKRYSFIIILRTYDTS